MSALLAGIDLSSKRIDAALIPLDPSDGSDAPPVTLRSFEMPTWKGETTPAFRTVERCRVVRAAMRELLRNVYLPGSAIYDFGTYPQWEGNVVHVCVETPLGSRSRSTVLWELYGAILASIPSHIERDTILTNEWRRIIWPGLKDQWRPGDWKASAIHEAYKLINGAPPFMGTQSSLDEHASEAYLLARACRERLEAAVKGAA